MDLNWSDRTSAFMYPSSKVKVDNFVVRIHLYRDTNKMDHPHDTLGASIRVLQGSLYMAPVYVSESLPFDTHCYSENPTQEEISEASDNERLYVNKVLWRAKDVAEVILLGLVAKEKQNKC